MVISPDFYQCYIRFPPNDVVPTEIHNNPKFYPFFQHCCGAIDGTHIDMFVPDDALTTCYRNCKGRLSQNVLAACTFDMRFSYVLAGWEGSAADSCIYMMMLGALTSLSPKIFATLLMQDFHYATHSLFLIVAYTII